MAVYIAERRVEFRDTDAAGIVHFSVFFTYMEAAEHEFLRSLDLSIVLEDAEGEFSFPRVAASCDYRSPIRFGDVVQIGVKIARVGEKSVSYEFDFRSDGREVAQGKITAVCCRLAKDGTLRSAPIPAEIAAKLRSVAG